MELAAIIKGMIIGFSIAAPVGPVGVLCIRRTLTKGRLAGFISGLGAASADSIYGCIAAFGLTSLSSLLVNQQTWLGIFGGCFLIYLGLMTFRAQPKEDSEAPGNEKKGLPGFFASTFLLTLTNPMTALSFVAFFTGVGFGAAKGGSVNPFLIVAGVFLGSSFWWFILSAGTGVFRRFLTGSGRIWINRISGIVIMAFGLAAFILHI